MPNCVWGTWVGGGGKKKVWTKDRYHFNSPGERKRIHLKVGKDSRGFDTRIFPATRKKKNPGSQGQIRRRPRVLV